MGSKSRHSATRTCALDRGTLAAIVIACVSIAASGLAGHDARVTAGHAVLLAISIGIIAFPDVINMGYRRTYQAMAHGSEPTPALLVRIAAWILLLVLVISLHASGGMRMRL